MILNVTFDHPAHVLRGRKRTEESVTLRSSVALALPEHGVADCPVAAWWTPPECKRGRVAVRVVEDGPAEPVLRDGGAVGDAFVDPAGSARGVVTAADLAGGIDASALGTGYSLTAADTVRGIARDDLPPGTRIVSDFEDRFASQVRAMAHGLCLVGGTLHRTGGTPVLEADGFDRSCKPRRIGPGQVHAPFDATRVYRLDDWDEAVGQGKYPARGDPGEPPLVLIPSALDFDMAVVMADATAERVASMGQRDRSRGGPALGVGTLGTPALLAWVDLRDLQRSGARGRDLLPALLAFREACDAGARTAFDVEALMLDRCMARIAEADLDPELADMTL